jgi:hypothetical protein
MIVRLLAKQLPDTRRLLLFWFIGPLVFNAVRAVHPTTPIIILGGA